MTGYGIALGFRVADARRIEAAMYRLRHIDKLILKGNWNEARRTFAAVEREFTAERGELPSAGDLAGTVAPPSA